MEDQQPWLSLDTPDLDYIRQNVLSLPRLNNKECIARYAGKLAGSSSILLVSANVTMDDRFLYAHRSNRSSLLFNTTTVASAIFWRMNSDWMCNKWNVPNRVSCTPKTMKSPYEETWTLVRFDISSNIDEYSGDDTSNDIWTKVDYCLPRDELRSMDDKCVLRISKVILSIITVLNLVKCICVALTIRLHNRISVNHRYPSNSTAGRGFVSHTFTRLFSDPKRRLQMINCITL